MGRHRRACCCGRLTRDWSPQGRQGTPTTGANLMQPAQPAQRAAASSACERAPIGLLAELTHRCPLQCPYCSNPLALDGAATELDTATWQDVLRQAAQLGVLQVHLS